MFNPVRLSFGFVGTTLAKYGLIDDHRAKRIGDLTWPRFLTMFARRSQSVADASMVGLSIGPAAIAGLAFATVYWQLAIGFSLGLVGGTISQVSQRYGAERFELLDLAVKQSVWVGGLLMLPFVAVYLFGATDLIGFFTSDAATIGHGADYLSVIAVALLFNTLNLVSSRTLAGADDTWIAMTVRATGAVANIVFNVIFIFGLGMGTAGAALGTLLAEAIITACFAWGFVVGGLPVVGAFPVQISLDGPYFDFDLSKQLLTISTPLMAEHLGRGISGFPLFAILAVFGPAVVAAFEVAKRVRDLLGALGAGFSMSASSLVGQELGRGDEAAAVAFSRDVVRFSAVVFTAAAAIVFVAAGPISTLFADDPSSVATMTPFVRVASVSFVGYGLMRSYGGILKAAGDNRWTMYGRLVGLYAFLLPLTYLGTVTRLGVLAVFAAMVAETWSATFVTGYRVVSGKWQELSRQYRPTGSGE